MGTKQAAGIVGAALIFLGVFVPCEDDGMFLLSYIVIWNVAGSVMLLTAAATLALMIRGEKMRLLWGIGAVVLLLTIGALIEQTMRRGDLVFTQWGWFLLFAGAATLLGVAGWNEYDLRAALLPPPRPKRYEEEAIEQTIQRMEAAMEAKDFSTLMTFVSDSFGSNRLGDKYTLLSRLEKCRSRGVLDTVKIDRSDAKMVITNDKVTVTPVMLAFGSRAVTLHFTGAKEDGVWKLLAAEAEG